MQSHKLSSQSYPQDFIVHKFRPQGYPQDFIVALPYTPWFDENHVAFDLNTKSLKYCARSSQEASALAHVLPPNCPLAHWKEAHVHYHHHCGEPFDPLTKECCAAAQHVATTHNGIKYNPQHLRCCHVIYRQFNNPAVVYCQSQPSMPYGYMGSLGMGPFF